MKQKVYSATDDASSMYDEDESRYGCDYDEDEDDDWDYAQDLDEWDDDDDDVYLDGEVHTEQVRTQKPCCQHVNTIYGVKPDGSKFYNRRGPDGKFSSN